jgi:hypothetical protein
LVVVPDCVPFTTTDALATGLPLSSVTLPVRVRWANAGATANTTPNRSRYSFLMCMLVFEDFEKARTYGRLKLLSIEVKSTKKRGFFEREKSLFERPFQIPLFLPPQKQKTTPFGSLFLRISVQADQDRRQQYQVGQCCRYQGQ